MYNIYSMSNAKMSIDCHPSKITGYQSKAIYTSRGTMSAYVNLHMYIHTYTSILV